MNEKELDEKIHAVENEIKNTSPGPHRNDLKRRLVNLKKKRKKKVRL